MELLTVWRQMCIRGIWRRVCGFLRSDEEDVVCKQMGYLRGERPGATDFGVGTSGQLILNDIACTGLGFEEELLECNYMVTTDTSLCTRDAVVRCVEGAPPTNLMLNLRGESNVTITWNPPNSILVMEHGLALNGYTTTCSSIDEDNQNTIIHTVLGPGILNTTVTGLRLAELDYECCVTADYNYYHPKNCLTINHTESTTISTTDTPTESTTDTPTETDSTTHQVPSTTSPTSVTIQDPLSLPVVINIVLGCVIALLVLLLVVAGVGLAYPRCVRSRVKDNSSVHMDQNTAYGHCHMSHNSAYGQSQQPSQDTTAAAGDDNSASRPNDPSYEVISLVQQDYEVV